MSASRTFARWLWILVRFLVGIVGFFVCIFAGVYALDNIGAFFLLLPVAIIGLFMMLFGVGRWGQWGYLFVFGSMPVCLMVIPWLYYQLFGTAMPSLLPFVGFIVAPFIVLVPVRMFYQTRRVQKHERIEHDTVA